MKTITYDETQWKLVPVEPTLAMLDCLRADTTPNLEKRYKSLLDAAPDAPAAIPADPLETKLPGDIMFGAGKVGKGCTLRTLQYRISALHDAFLQMAAQRPEAPSFPKETTRGTWTDAKTFEEYPDQNTADAKDAERLDLLIDLFDRHLIPFSLHELRMQVERIKSGKLPVIRKAARQKGGA